MRSVPDLKEVEVGEWEGRNWADIEKNEPAAYAAFREDPGKHGYPGGETLQDLLDRVTPALEGLMGEHVGEEIVVVAHSVVNRVYCGSLLGISLAKGYFIPQANCCVNVVRFRAGESEAGWVQWGDALDVIPVRYTPWISPTCYAVSQVPRHPCIQLTPHGPLQ